MRNFDISTGNSMPLDRSKIDGSSEMVDGEERDGGNGFGASNQYLDSVTPQVFGDLSPEALNYIQRLQSELTNVKEVSTFSQKISLFHFDEFYVHFEFCIQVWTTCLLAVSSFECMIKACFDFFCQLPAFF